MAAKDAKEGKMKAIGFVKSGAAKDVFALVEVPIPKATERDLLVKLLSIATNPVDTKQRKFYQRPKSDEKDESKWPIKIVGWDAAGIVKEIGPGVKNFKVGDEVYFAGVVNRQGSYAEYVAVDERLVGHKPKSLSWDQAATVPLCALTAWEALLEQFAIPVPANADDEKLHASKSLLIVAGAGGVGSIAIQIAKKVLKIGKVIATSSRKETDEWCKSKGADASINHKQKLQPQLEALGFPNGVDYVLNAAEAEHNFDEVVTTVAAFGKICCITGLPKPVSIGSLFHKRATVSFEFMFARGLTKIDMEKQAAILDAVSKLLDAGTLGHNLTRVFEFTLPDVIKANELQESGTAIGKIAITVAKS